MVVDTGWLSGTVLLSSLVMGSCLAGTTQAQVAVGTTRIAAWRDDKVAAFLLMFDDGVPSHLATVIPELRQRGLTGTFYLNPGVPWYAAGRSAWETNALLEGVVLANHTMTHKGAQTAAEAEEEIARCNEYLLKILPNPGQPRLLSFCKPGGSPWTVPPEETKRLMVKYNLIPRPAADGRFGGVHLKTAAALTQVIDQAVLKTNGTDYLFFHGVGGDWLVTPKADFITMLDHLVAHRASLWITDPVSAHQYETERKGGAVKVVEAGVAGIRLSLSTKADAALYTLPLTLVTCVPPGWTECRVEQGGTKVTVKADKGSVRFDAVPGPLEIRITPLR